MVRNSLLSISVKLGLRLLPSHNASRVMTAESLVDFDCTCQSCAESSLQIQKIFEVYVPAVEVDHIRVLPSEAI